MATSNTTDFIVVGGGIVGLATAWQLMRQFAGAKITLLEKEPRVGLHQSGRNSGVLHSGIYYKPGSLKALTCRAGKAAMEQFCREHSVRFETCGKIIVAIDEKELPGLERIHERGVENGVTSHWLDEARHSRDRALLGGHPSVACSRIGHRGLSGGLRKVVGAAVGERSCRAA